MIGWAQNLTKKLSKEYTKTLDFQTSSVYALFWNICCKQLLKEVVDDIDGFVTKNNLWRMDSNTEGKNDSTGVYFVEKAGRKVEFHNVKLAPPSGALGINYARQDLKLFHFRSGGANYWPDLYTMSAQITSMPSPGQLDGQTQPLNPVATFTWPSTQFAFKVPAILQLSGVLRMSTGRA